MILLIIRYSIKRINITVVELKQIGIITHNEVSSLPQRISFFCEISCCREFIFFEGLIISKYRIIKKITSKVTNEAINTAMCCLSQKYNNSIIDKSKEIKR